MRRSAARQRYRLVVSGLLVAVAVATSLFLTRDVDFRVYWYAADAFLNECRPLYGHSSGAGFPMHYRYPPVTYLLLWPLGSISLYWAGVIWMIGAWATAAGATLLMIRAAHLQFSPTAIVAASAYLLAYIVLAVHSGNVQPYLIAMILAAMAISESRPVMAAVLLAIAITFKIWPLFFLPWFLWPARRRVLVWLIPALVVLWAAPLTVWSPSHYLDLLHQWSASEFQSATTNSESWYFPGQSLRGILLRYLTTVGPWIQSFPDIHVFSFSPQTVIRVWEDTALALYLTACAAMLRSDARRRWIWDGFSFVLFTLLQPFCLKSGMISLGPAILVAAALYSTEFSRLARRMFLAASVLSFVGAIAQYKPLLRLLLALGIDFYAAVFLLTALLLALIRKPEADLGGTGTAGLKQRSEPGIGSSGAKHQVLHRRGLPEQGIGQKWNRVGECRMVQDVEDVQPNFQGCSEEEAELAVKAYVELAEPISDDRVAPERSRTPGGRHRESGGVETAVSRRSRILQPHGHVRHKIGSPGIGEVLP